MILTDVAQVIEDLATAVLLFNILKWILIVAVIGTVLFFVIRATCNYQARKNADEFDYDYLAERTAEEVCKRLLIIEGQKSVINKVTSDRADDQGDDNCDESRIQGENL